MTDAQVLFNENSTELALDNHTQTLQYIQDAVIPNMLGPLDVSIDHYLKVNKNNNIKKSVRRTLRSLSDSASTLCIYSYGKHIQKLLSILQITSARLPKGTKLQQWNKLSSFTQIKHKHGNELIDDKITIPIFITVVTTGDAQLDPLYSAKFTKQ
ncbi:hypothetical protein TPHA_0K01280 [Tetrapisispora phaffii CBS 4417]|uniref:DNA/RNA-binding protein Alba-like domain-containing protein n=1 Tax=Tetrapisispora phaffii (strain ATCC 24235 / CBS 4417 / NBRC 1672 / NRRL Y-8282 / UCD 70-5) TaxID=1071381 RepID=G8BZD4_TETPH|nr:hypothetical protein TPHA_0K01280 [Tetrapisispora phaffii CBS 4417]CCE65262.1 hypothetical protein TPHA_0K01280 [Tetrapisispora phaffii CBS 4417]